MGNEKYVQEKLGKSKKRREEEDDEEDDSKEKPKNVNIVIKNAILECDTLLLNEESIDMVVSNLPTDEEKKLIDSWASENGDKNPQVELDAPEIFFLDIRDISAIPHRLNCLKFHLTVKKSFESVSTLLVVLKEATESLKDNTKFPRILEIALACGNFLNSGTRLGNTWSFPIENLNSLRDTKSTTNTKASLLDFIVETVFEKFPALNAWPESIKHLKQASEASWDTIETRLQEVKNEADKSLENSKGINVEASADKFGKYKLYMQEHKQNVDELVTLKDQVYQNWKTLAETYGCDIGESKPDTFFKIISDFATEFKTMIKELNDKKEKEEETLRKEDEKAKVELKRQEIAERKKTLEARKRSHGISSGSDSSATIDISENSDSSPNPVRKTTLASSALRKSTKGVGTREIVAERVEKKTEKEAENVLNDMLGQLVTGGREKDRGTVRSASRLKRPSGND